MTAKRIALSLLSVFALSSVIRKAPAQTHPSVKLPETVLFGAAYYDEYAPTDRLENDIAMMKAAHISVVRIAESTWATEEPEEGRFDFSHVDRVLSAMDKAGIKVIVGTPTYAVPAWLARKHPDVLAITARGPNKYGARQNMDITNTNFRAAAQAIIIALVDHVKAHPSVIGYQVDNETKSYGTSGPNVQAAFVAHLQRQWPDLNAFNKAFGLDYWSNRIDNWADFPDVTGTINNSLSAAFAEFQRSLVTDYLQWQSDLVHTHARPDQFVTQNFDLDFRGYSYGVQSQVNHFDAARALDVAGIDIYHPTQTHLTGTEIAFGGDMARSLRHGQNYLVIETEAQGFPEWLPFPGQLRLQAFSHLASGANMVEYWHWSTTSNAVETYWRGLLSQDGKTNPTYEEARTIGADLARLGPRLVNMKKHNRIAIYVSNRALTAFDSFKFGWTSPITYSDVVRPFYDALYRQNDEVDFIDPSTTDLSQYKLIVVPALYAASSSELTRLNDFAKAGGHVFYSFKSGFSDENVKVRSTDQPGLIAESAGVVYNQFTLPENISLAGDPYHVGAQDNQARWWMELLTPTTAKEVARYQSPVWGHYAAITRNTFGRGEVTYLGFMPSDALLEKLVQEAVGRAGLTSPAQTAHFPSIIRSGTLQNGHAVHYLLNYSADPQGIPYDFEDGRDLISGTSISGRKTVQLGPWEFKIIEENQVASRP